MKGAVVPSSSQNHQPKTPAEVLREAAETAEETNPDRSYEFSEGVDWVVDLLRTLADVAEGGAS
jgi:hypothetical protein